MELTEEQHAATVEWIELSAKLRKNDSDAKQTVLRERLAAVIAQHKEHSAHLAGLKGQLTDLHNRAARDAQAIELLQDTIRKEQDRMNAGVGLTSKDLVALGREIDATKAKLRDMEDRQLRTMRDEEDCQSRIESMGEKLNQAATEGKALQEEAKTTAALLKAEANEFAGKLDAALRRMYNFGGEVLARAEVFAGVAVLRAGACGGCGTGLSGSALDALIHAGPYAVGECENCEAFLIKA